MQPIAQDVSAADGIGPQVPGALHLLAHELHVRLHRIESHADLHAIKEAVVHLASEISVRSVGQEEVLTARQRVLKKLANQDHIQSQVLCIPADHTFARRGSSRRDHTLDECSEAADQLCG